MRERQDQAEGGGGQGAGRGGVSVGHLQGDRESKTVKISSVATVGHRSDCLLVPPVHTSVHFRETLVTHKFQRSTDQEFKLALSAQRSWQKMDEKHNS